MISAGEVSGDMHGAALLRAMRGLRPGLSFCGMGGDELARAGMEVLVEAEQVSVVGVAEVLGQLPAILAARRRLVERLRDPALAPDLLIIIDFPDFNLGLARQARRAGIPVFYYIPPQVWAWRQGRVRTIARRCDRVAVILPFEREFHARHGLDVDYVGHPLADTVRPAQDPASWRKALGIPATAPLVGLLPGSRGREVETLLPCFLQAARLVVRQVPEARFVLPRAPGISPDLLAARGLSACPVPVSVVDQDRHGLMQACDACLAASGTVTLELALLDTPQVVAYRLSPLTYRLGRLLVRGVRHFALVNLVAGEEIMPELLQDQATPENLCASLLPLLLPGARRDQALRDLARVRHLLGSGGAARRAADIALELLARAAPGP